MFIQGIGISGYKSFGEHPQKIGPFSKINIIIGQNNSGKSNILSFIDEHYNNFISAANKDTELTFGETDVALNSPKGESRLSICFRLNSKEFQELLLPNTEGLRTLLIQFLKAKSLSNDENTIWITYLYPTGIKYHIDPLLVDNVIKEQHMPNNNIYYLCQKLSMTTGGSIQTWVPEILQYVFRKLIKPVQISLIPAFRRIGEEGTSPTDFSGTGLISKLAELQHPEFNEQHKREYFNDITELLQNVTGNPTAQIDIPFNQKRINVKMDGKILPLSSLGTGIHEVIILAAAATTIKNQVICIEEPELHLHPHLQKKLIRYLNNKTNNQYFLTTHSAHLLDTPGASIFHVRQHETDTIIDSVFSPAEKSQICVDLGYRASDILQSNSVIWVEGPSDRIYLKHWIKAVDANLIEGVDYSIMFYGGRLLSHLCADDKEVDEFISLRRLNRFISILIDSDRQKRGAKLNETKMRVKNEFLDSNGFAWITKGKEIENYIDPELLEQSIKIIHPTVDKIIKKEQYANPMLCKTKTGKQITADKVKVAHHVVKSPANLGILDLSQMVEKLVSFIREANHFNQE